VIKLKTKEEINKLKVAGQKLATIVDETAQNIKSGISTEELDNIAGKLFEIHGVKSSFKGYTPVGADRPYPANICVSINNEIVHGIPNEEPVILKEGDIVTVDAGLIYEGLYTDHARTFIVGKNEDSDVSVEIPKEVKKLLAKTEEALYAGIKAAKVGGHIGDIGEAISKVANESNLSVIKDLTGHGVGYAVHEDPFVPNEGIKGQGEVIEEGLVIAIEPMFSLGSPFIKTANDGYTYLTEDDSLSAQFEHTIAVTIDGPIILTKK
jgi:methionyl aminopeptidase